MVGRKIEFSTYESSQIGKPLLEVKKLSKKGNYRDISFTLHEDEIIGITGLVGAGKTEMIQALYGLNTPGYRTNRFAIGISCLCMGTSENGSRICKQPEGIRQQTLCILTVYLR